MSTKLDADQLFIAKETQLVGEVKFSQQERSGVFGGVRFAKRPASSLVHVGVIIIEQLQDAACERPGRAKATRMSALRRQQRR